MANEISIKVTGLAELENKLMAMSQEMAAKNIVSSAYSCNKKIEDAAKSNINSAGLVDTGLLLSSIKRKKIIYGNRGIVVIVTGVSKGVSGVDRKGRKRVPFRYANILEPRHHFVANAARDNKETVVGAFVKSLERKIKKFTKA